MKKHWITILLLILGGYIMAQSLVEFSTSEGYENGALRNQNNWDATNTYPGNWIVDAEGDGMVWADKMNQRAIWGVPNILTGAGDKITFRVEFDCELESMPTTNSLMYFGFIAKPNVGTGQEDNTKMNVIHFKKAVLTVQLRNNNNAANLSPDASIPLEEVDDPATTKVLRLAVEISLTLGVDAASSTMSGKIINLSKSTETAIGSYTGINADLYNAATSTGLYGTFGSGANNSKPIVYKVSMQKVITSVELPGSSQPFFSVDKRQKQLMFNASVEGENLSIFDLTGKEVFTGIVNSPTVDLKILDNGVYFLKLKKLTGKFLL
ncbi:MAG: T9SS type A sorting domain-containing protein [Paludibacter sp.]|jgi:hypothetical protein|nr:T9SS type A sorting domain-containing protein [Paludibacter sp.]